MSKSDSRAGFQLRFLIRCNDFSFFKDIFSNTIYNNLSKFLRAFYRHPVVMTAAGSLIDLGI